MRRSCTCSSTASRSATEKRVASIALTFAAIVCAAAGWAGAARAHAPAAPATRELLRLQGHKAEAADCAARAIVLSALGKGEAFCADEYRRLAVATEKPIELEKQPDAIDLQGSRALLARFAKARRDQRITILGEWRPGRRDLFLIDLDLCPEE